MRKKFEGVFPRQSARAPELTDGSAFSALERIAREQPWPFDDDSKTTINIVTEKDTIRLEIEMQTNEARKVVEMTAKIQNAVEAFGGQFNDISSGVQKS